MGSASSLRAQTSRTDPTDTHGWLGAQLALDLPRRWEASLQYRLRRVDNLSTMRGSFYTAELGRRVGKGITLFGSYRLADVDDGTYHRIAAGGELGRKWAGSTVSVRTMVQYQRQNFTDNDEASSDADAFVRTRFEVKRTMAGALDLYASTEPYLKLGDTGGGYLLDNWRNTLGLKWEYAKGRKLDLFYIYRPDYGKSYNRTFHVVGVNLDFKHKLGRPKSKGGKPVSATAGGG